MTTIPVTLNRHKFKTVHVTARENSETAMDVLDTLVEVAAQQLAQDVLLDIKASTGATSGELDRLKAAAMGAKVGPASATESFLELLKAGMDLEKVLGGAGQAAIAFGRVGRMSAGESAVRFWGLRPPTRRRKRSRLSPESAA